MPTYRHIKTGHLVEVLEGTRMCKAYELVKDSNTQECVKNEVTVAEPKKSARKNKKKSNSKNKLKEAESKPKDTTDAEDQVNKESEE